MEKLRKFYTHTPQQLALLIFGLASTIGVFHGGIWASLGIVGGILAYMLTCWLEGRWLQPRRDLLLVCAGLLVLCVISAAQSPYPDVSWRFVLQMASVALPLSAFSIHEVQQRLYAPKLLRWMALLLVLGVLALGYEQMFGAPLLHLARGKAVELTEYNRGFSYAMMLAWPVGAFVWLAERKYRALLFVLALIPALLVTQSRATQMAMVIAGGAFVAMQISPLLTRRLLQASVLVLLPWPFFAQYLFIHNAAWVTKLPDSWHARIEIWDYVGNRILQRPWLGWGGGVTYKIPVDPAHASLYQFVPVQAGHPHNLFAQAWLELGLPGLFLVAFFALLTLHWARYMPIRLAPFAVSAWVGCFTLSLCAYNFWADSFLAMFTLVALAFVLLQQRLGVKA